jgi:hypothetical protein
MISSYAEASEDKNERYNENITKDEKDPFFIFF